MTQNVKMALKLETKCLVLKYIGYILTHTMQALCPPGMVSPLNQRRRAEKKSPYYTREGDN